MRASIISLLSTLAIATAPAALASETIATNTADPDSIVTRNAQGTVTSRSVFATSNGIREEHRMTDTQYGQKIRTAYNSRGLATSETTLTYNSKLGIWTIAERTDMTYDVAGRCVQKTTHTADGTHLRTHYAYDADGRLLSEVSEVWDATDDEWDPQKKYEYAYTYDRTDFCLRGYALRSHYFWANDEQGWQRQADRESYDYNCSGQMTSRCREDNYSDKATCTHYEYDDEGRLTTAKTGHYGNNSLHKEEVETYTYDAAGRTTSVKVTGSDGALISTTTYYYSTRAQAQKATKAKRLDHADVLDTEGNILRRRSFNTDESGRPLGISYSNHIGGNVWDNVKQETFSAGSDGTRRFENEVIFVGGCELDPAQITEYVLDEHGRRVLGEVYRVDYNQSSGDTLVKIDALQYLNTYDTEGRMSSYVQLSTSAGLTDSVSYAYDVVNRYASPVAKSDSTSGNFIGRIWMRLSGLFGSRHSGVDSAAVAEAVADSLMAGGANSMVERVHYVRNGGQWTPSERSVGEFDEDGLPVTISSYAWDAAQKQWVPTGRDEFKSSDRRVDLRRGYKWDPEKNEFVLFEKEKYYYS